MNRHNYVNKNGVPSTCWICQPKYKREALGGKKIGDANSSVWYVRTISKRPYATTNLIYIAHSYTEARAKQLVFLEKAKRNVKR